MAEGAWKEEYALHCTRKQICIFICASKCTQVCADLCNGYYCVCSATDLIGSSKIRQGKVGSLLHLIEYGTVEPQRNTECLFSCDCQDILLPKTFSDGCHLSYISTIVALACSVTASASFLCLSRLTCCTILLVDHIGVLQSDWFIRKTTPIHLGFPRREAWCRALKPLLFATVTSALDSSNIVTISSRFLEMASCNGVSPSVS